MQTPNPFLSVIVPAYNIEQYIGQCIESILKQSFEDFELLLVDDGSQDKTGEICDEYAKCDDRIKVIHKKNGGLVSARKAGIYDSTGKYVTYVDGDDWIAENAFEVMCTKAKETDADVIIADFISAGREQSRITQNMESGYYTKKSLIEEVYPQMLSHGEYFSFGFQPAVWGKIFRRNVILPHQLQVDERIRLGEDVACSYACLLGAESIYYLKEKYIYFYRMRESSISHAIIKTYYTNEIILLAEQLEEEFKKYPEIFSKLEVQLYYYIVYMIENMFTPNLRLGHVLFSKGFRDEIAIFGNSVIGEKICDFVKTHRVSSRARRIIKIAEKNTISRRMNLILFYQYEKIMSCYERNRKKGNV